ncbi:MAG: HD domain-containing protein [Deltaproteobacteria bacterium]|nr:HD domain-containing protein [Deltaproteobacteria bacterium]
MHLTINNKEIPHTVLDISRRLLKNGHQAFIVGGAIRDSLLGCQAKDWDVATDATPDRIRDLFPEITSFNLKHGTVTLVSKGRHFEVTTFRGTGGFGANIEEDLAHRDFTFNAMAYDITHKRIIDPFEGKQDVKKKVVRAVVNPAERFQEDPLRMMRAIRFSLQLGYTVDPETLIAINSMAEAIDRVAKERIRDELLSILMVRKPSVGFNLMRKTGLLNRILPELLEGYKKRQNNYHRYTIYRHTIETVDSIDRDTILRLSALFHDIAKPRVRKKIKGRWRFLGHATVSADLAREIMTRLRFSNDRIARVTGLVAHHMFDYKQELSDRAIRRFIKRVGADNISDLIALRKADDLAHGWGKIDENQIEEFKNRINSQIKKSYPFTISDLAVNGNDVMNVLDLQPGPRVGQILNQLLEKVIDKPGCNKKDILIEILNDMKE